MLIKKAEADAKEEKNSEWRLTIYDLGSTIYFKNLKSLPAGKAGLILNLKLIEAKDWWM